MPTWNASARHLERSVPMLLSLSLCGLSMAGADVAGFMGDPDSELFVRWHQLGIWKLGTKMTIEHPVAIDRYPKNNGRVNICKLKHWRVLRECAAQKFLKNSSKVVPPVKVSFQQIWVMWLDGNPGWWTRMIRKKDFLMIQVSMVDFFDIFRRGYLISEVTTVPRLREYAGNTLKATHQPRYPFYRAHAHLTSKRREPWLFGTAVLDKVRESVLTRYRLLPMWWLGTVRIRCEAVRHWRTLKCQGKHFTFSIRNMLPATSSSDKIYIHTYNMYILYISETANFFKKDWSINQQMLGAMRFLCIFNSPANSPRYTLAAEWALLGCLAVFSSPNRSLEQW